METYTFETYGHDWKLEPHPDIPKGRTGWECMNCTLFVMTDNSVDPVLAETIYISGGSFPKSMWSHWECNDYQLRVAEARGPEYKQTFFDG